MYVINSPYLRVKASRVEEKIRLSVVQNQRGRRSSVFTGAKYPETKLA